MMAALYLHFKCLMILSKCQQYLGETFLVFILKYTSPFPVQQVSGWALFLSNSLGIPEKKEENVWILSQHSHGCFKWFIVHVFINCFPGCIKKMTIGKKIIFNLNTSFYEKFRYNQESFQELSGCFRLKCPALKLEI